MIMKHGGVDLYSNAAEATTFTNKCTGIAPETFRKILCLLEIYDRSVYSDFIVSLAIVVSPMKDELNGCVKFKEVQFSDDMVPSNLNMYIALAYANHNKIEDVMVWTALALGLELLQMLFPRSYAGLIIHLKLTVKDEKKETTGFVMESVAATPTTVVEDTTY